ncbi:MAG: hypothetical protein AAF628_26280 [Planctomycetota bacterium]
MTETVTPKPTEAQKPVSAPQNSLIIRPWPKVVYFYPTLIAATLFWLISALSSTGGTEGLASLGNIFMLVFGLNLLVFAFDFSRIKTITIVIGAIAVVLGIGWANTQWGWFEGIKTLFGQIDIRMNTQYYGFISALLAATLLTVFINTRFNYYEINHRELLHHHGYLGDITRIPTAGLLVHKEIYDLLEYVLLRSGRLIFYPQGKREAIVIDNVLNVNRVENHIKDLLSVVAVRMQDHSGPIEH